MLDRLLKQREETGTHPHDWDLPSVSSKRTRSRSSNDHFGVPSQSIFKDVSIPYSRTNNCTAPPTFEQYPAPGHVAAHLLLVECFQKLREDVESSSRIKTDIQTRTRRPRSDTSVSTTSTWTTYLKIAIERFRLWITKIESTIRHAAVFNRYGTGSHLHGAFTQHYLPPIDVLFIWYSYLQSPAAYQRLIASNDFKLLSQICFPWHLLPTSINQTTLEYSFSHAARTLWANLVGIPPDLEDCVDLDFNDDTVAFMSAPSEMLDIALRQSEFIEKVAQYQWLRSPSLRATIQRALHSYTKQMFHTPNCETEHTQQVPMDSLEAHSIHDLDLDLPSQLVLHTHQAYHSAWQIFAQLNNLKNEDMPPPPSYDESNQATMTQVRDVGEYGDSKPCYCWICERVQEELETDADNTTILLTPLRRVASPDNEKCTITSESSSESEDSLSTLDLTKQQIKAIKADIAMYRHIENVRLKRSAK